MTATTLDKKKLAAWYARQHYKVDPGIRSIFYLPTDAPEREIRLLEVNVLIAERAEGSLEPVDFGVDTGMETAHSLLVLDLTPRQWSLVREASLELPSGWCLNNAIEIKKR